jgi:hypothetical protein
MNGPLKDNFNFEFKIKSPRWDLIEQSDHRELRHCGEMNQRP